MKTQRSSEDKAKSLLTEDMPKYPYGLKIHLGQEEMEKLDFKSAPRVGDKFMLKGFVVVSSVSESENEGEAKERSVSLQITNMLLGPAAESKEPEEVFHGQAPKAKML